MSHAEGWRYRLISFRVLALIVLALGSLRVLVALLMPSSVSSWAPDEGTYAILAGLVGTGGDWQNWSGGWGSSLYPKGRALIGPAAVLVAVGADDIAAVRVVSSVYAIGSQLLLLVVARLARRRVAHDRAEGLTLVSWPMLGIAVFVLMPSTVVWSNLGLRESACAFWILATVAAATYLFSTQDWRWKALFGLAIAFSIAMTFQSRYYLAAALVISLAVVVVWLGKEGPRVSFTLACAIAGGALIGITLTFASSPSTVAEPAPQAQSVPVPVADALDSIRQGAAAAPEVLNPETYLEAGSYQREASALYADSAIATDACLRIPGALGQRWCELSRLPGAAFAVMFRPLWPFDSPAEWSLLAVMASIENVAWLGLVLIAVGLLLTRRFPLARVLTISVTYGALVVAGMAALEGNFGTAFRHKSNVLWVLCVILILAGSRRSRSLDQVRGAASTSGPNQLPASRHEIEASEPGR